MEPKSGQLYDVLNLILGTLLFLSPSLLGFGSDALTRLR
jgi:hypothetical protein